MRCEGDAVRCGTDVVRCEGDARSDLQGHRSMRAVGASVSYVLCFPANFTPNS